MGSLSGSKPYFSDQEFASASEAEIEEVLYQEKQIGVKLLSQAQRKQLEAGRQTVSSNTVQQDMPVVNNQVGEVRRGVDAVLVEEDGGDILADGVKQFEYPDKHWLSKVQRLRKAAVFHHAIAAELSKKWKRWRWFLYFSAAVNVSMAVNRLTEIASGEEAMPQLKDDSQSVLVNQLKSDLIASEIFRQADACWRASEALFLRSELANRDNLKYRPKGPQACQVLSDLAKEKDAMLDKCRIVLDRKIEAVGLSVQQELEKVREDVRAFLVKAQVDYQSQFKDWGYDRCPKSSPQKK